MGSSSKLVPQTLLFLMFTLFLYGNHQSQAAAAAATSYLVNVLKFGAIADGKTDNSKALNDAWNEACKHGGNNVILIPLGTFLVRPIIFQGPCMGRITLTLKGVLRAPTDKASTINVDHWISFRYIDGLTINGHGLFDAQGASAWPYNTCLTNPNCPTLPVSIRLDFVNRSSINHITVINSKNFHFNIFASNDVRINHVKISSPGDSPNTDGIHVAESTGVDISDTSIAAGDDCVSIGPGCNNINITNVNCGPGHGFSIGSLGGSANEKDVSGIAVRNCTLTTTLSGLRIKTWARSHPSTCSDITFEHINVVNVNDPILIDQNYCPSQKCGQQGESMVKIEGARFRNIWGNSSSKIAVSLQCSKSRPCRDVELKDINIDYDGVGGPTSSASCSNVQGVAYGQQHPPSCIH